MKVGVLFSGGKDSCLALAKVLNKKKMEVLCLISVISKNQESYMFHTPNIKIVDLQAKAIGLPLIKKVTKGEKEKELIDLKKAIKEAKEKFKIEGIVTGAIRSVYQAKRIKKICEDLNLKCLNPLWHQNEEKLLYEILKNKFKVIISGVFAYPLGKEWLGKLIDKKCIKELIKLNEKYKINPMGEGGEIETTVLDAPFFKKKIEILDYEIDFKDYSGVFVIKKAVLRSV